MSARSTTELYEDDFFAWTQLQARELRRFARMRPNLPLDLGHIAEEIAGLGKNQRDSLQSWARRIIEHRLTPTLQRDRLPNLYDRACRDLQRKLAPFGEGDVVDRLPKDCPYTLDQVLGDFWPGAEAR